RVGNEPIPAPAGIHFGRLRGGCTMDPDLCRGGIRSRQPWRIGKMQLGRLGVWAAMDAMTAAEGAAFAKRVEGWGYAALWLPESRGRNVLVHSSWLLANTTRLIVAPGIANIYARDAMAMANGQRALAEQSGGRFLLGLGVSHVPSVEGVRGHVYGRPVATMRGHLDAMKAAPYGAPEPAEAPLTVLPAPRPRMIA